MTEEGVKSFPAKIKLALILHTSDTNEQFGIDSSHLSLIKKITGVLTEINMEHMWLLLQNYVIVNSTVQQLKPLTAFGSSPKRDSEYLTYHSKSKLHCTF